MILFWRHLLLLGRHLLAVIAERSWIISSDEVHCPRVYETVNVSQFTGFVIWNSTIYVSTSLMNLFKCTSLLINRFGSQYGPMIDIKARLDNCWRWPRHDLQDIPVQNRVEKVVPLFSDTNSVYSKALFTCRNAFGMSSWEYILETYNSLFEWGKITWHFCVPFCKKNWKTDHIS